MPSCLQGTAAREKMFNDALTKAYKLNPQKCDNYDDQMVQVLLQMAKIDVEAQKITTALEKDPKNVKLLMKRAKTYLGSSFEKELSYYPG